MDLLAENNACGQQILRIVAHGNSIIAELMRLSKYIPSILRLETKSDQQKYGDVIFDFVYFKSSSVLEKKIEESEILTELDEGIRESHGSMLSRIYSAFESIHLYVSNLLSFLQDLSDGVYIQQTMEYIFMDEDGKQLMCEALYLYGVMLLKIEVLFPGVVRERLIVAFHRHYGMRAARDTNIDDVCKLLRSTGYSSVSGSKKPANYPENFFNRINIPEEYIDLVLGYLRSDDIYHQVQAYPLPDHRTTALANQAAMMYVCLYFSPSTLHSHSSRMREIVDKFFSDSWVVSFYMGMTVNLVEVWDCYKAAKLALSNVLENSNVKLKAKQMSTSLSKQIQATDELLANSKLSEGAVVNDSSKIINILRQCNVVFRWIILHTSNLALSGCENNKKCIALRQQVINEMQFNPSVFFDLLIKTSNLELLLSETFKRLVTDKESKWNRHRKSAHERTFEIASVFDGSQPLVKVAKNDQLNKWFRDIGEQILNLSLDQLSLSARKIIQIIDALRQVKDFHELDSSAGIVQAVDEVIRDLKALVKVSRINDNDLVMLVLISDLSYAWNLIEDYTSVMQQLIKQSPERVSPLRAVFLKLSSGLELPLLRINQAKSDDLMSVSAYYSGQLVTYIRKVLQIIPETMFSLLNEITKLQGSMLEIPTRLDKDKLKDYAQLDQRFKMAELTHRVGCLADGVSMMKNTLVGIVEIDPRKLLEEGVRRELINQVSNLLHQSFIFSPKVKEYDLKKRLVSVGQEMKAFQTSFEYIQDYINCYGVKMWQEEITRIINYCVEQECNPLLKKKVSSHESKYQSSAIPIPNHSPTDQYSVNFIGRLLRELLRMTYPRSSIYIPSTETWYDVKNHKEIISSAVMNDIKSSICVAGLVGIDKLLAFLIVKELQDFCSEVEGKTISGSSTLPAFEELSDLGKCDISNIHQPQKKFLDWIQRHQKLCPNIIENVLKIGQMQILRCQISNQLRNSCKLQAKPLFSLVEALNSSLLNDVQRHYDDPTKPYPDPDGLLTIELSKLLEKCGLTSALDKIYITPKSSHLVSVILFATVICQVNKMSFSKDLGSLISNKGSDAVDGHCFVVGISSVLRQFHSHNSEDFLRMVGQFVNSFVLATSTTVSTKNNDFPTEALTGLGFLKAISKQIRVPSEAQAKYISPLLLSQYNI